MGEMYFVFDSEKAVFVERDSRIQTIKIKMLSAALLPPVWHSNGDWIDLRSAARVPMRKGEFRMIPLGVAMQLPEGYEAHVVPRSSTFKTWGILMTNSMGVIDESYCGDGDQWHFPAYATRDTVIEVNDRICQFRLMRHQPELVFEEVKTLGNSDRGGIGSTGKR